MADLQQDRIGGGEPGPYPNAHEEQHFDHVAVGYTNRTTLDDFIDGEAGDLVVRGPFHAGESVSELKTLGSSVTQGTPCLVVPLVHERMDQIQREVNAALDAFQSRWEPESAEERQGEERRGAEARGGRSSARRTTRGAERSSLGEARAARGRGRQVERGRQAEHGRNQTGSTSAQRQARPRTYRETGGTARGTSSGAIRKGSLGPNAD